MYTKTRTTVSTVFYAALFAVTLGACATDSSPKRAKLSNVHYQLGVDYLSKRMPDAAKAELIEALEYNDDNVDAHFYLGVIYFMEGVHASNFVDHSQCLRGTAAEEQRKTSNDKMREAERQLKRAVSLAKKRKRKQTEALNYLANVAIHFGRYDEAVSLCSRALEDVLYRDRHLALGNRGWAYFLKRDFGRAARDLRQALYRQPKFCIARFRLAKVYYAQGSFGKAAEALKRVTEDKGCPIQESYQLLGLVYLKQKRPDIAEKQFKRCISLDPASCVSTECKRYTKLL